MLLQVIGTSIACLKHEHNLVGQLTGRSDYDKRGEEMRVFLFLIAFDLVLSCHSKSFCFFSIQLIKKRIVLVEMSS